jgi:hypothetical protein
VTLIAEALLLTATVPLSTVVARFALGRLFSVMKIDQINAR